MSQNSRKLLKYLRLSGYMIGCIVVTRESRMNRVLISYYKYCVHTLNDVYIFVLITTLLNLHKSRKRRCGWLLLLWRNGVIRKVVYSVKRIWTCEKWIVYEDNPWSSFTLSIIPVSIFRGGRKVWDLVWNINKEQNRHSDKERVHSALGGVKKRIAGE